MSSGPFWAWAGDGGGAGLPLSVWLRMKTDCRPCCCQGGAPCWVQLSKAPQLAVCDSHKNNSSLQRLLTISEHFIFFDLPSPHYPCDTGIIISI